MFVNKLKEGVNMLLEVSQLIASIASYQERMQKLRGYL